jgi:hypothetical protein
LSIGSIIAKKEAVSWILDYRTANTDETISKTNYSRIRLQSEEIPQHSVFTVETTDETSLLLEGKFYVKEGFLGDVGKGWQITENGLSG